MGFLIHSRPMSAWFLGIAAVMAAVLVSGETPMGRARERCTGDVELPIHVRLVPVQTPHPGALLQVRVEVEALRPFSEASITVRAPADVPVTAGQHRELGPLTEGRSFEHEFTILVPAHGQRRTVDVHVRAGSDDGFTIDQGATLNLSFEDEPSRVVTDQDGTLVREVPARRIQ
jgi:hypothetical protein